MILVALRKERFINVGYKARFTVAASLLRAHPIFSIFADFGANVRESTAENLPITALSLDILDGAIGLITHRTVSKACFVLQCMAECEFVVALYIV